MKQVVIGLGEVGQPLFNILKRAYADTVTGYDIKGRTPFFEADIMHVCIPYWEGFIREVRSYQEHYKATITVIHTTVPIGTTKKIKKAVHSPVLGSHKDMEKDLQAFHKWVGGDGAETIVDVFRLAGMRSKAVETSEQTEMMKLMCLAEYGINIAFALYKKNLCDQYGFDSEDFMSWEMDYNLGVPPNLRRPLIIPTDPYIGGALRHPWTAYAE